MLNLIFLAAFVFQAPAQARMGEVERAFGWGANIYGFGTILSHVEGERMRIKADYEIKKAEFRNRMEVKTTEALKIALKQELAELKLTIGKLKSLDSYYTAQNTVFTDLSGQMMDVLKTRRTNEEVLEALIETIRQEIAENDSSVQTLEQLKSVCDSLSAPSSRAITTCSLVSALVADTNFINGDSSSAYRTGVRLFDKFQSKSVKERSKLKALIDESEIIEKALQTKLESQK